MAEHEDITLQSVKIFVIFPNFLSLKSSVNSTGNSYIPCLLLIIKLRLTCGETKIWSDIKKSQNIMNMIVGLCIQMLSIMN